MTFFFCFQCFNIGFAPSFQITQFFSKSLYISIKTFFMSIVIILKLNNLFIYSFLSKNIIVSNFFFCFIIFFIRISQDFFIYSLLFFFDKLIT
nr:MAG TPA: hypothetical protein [Caudoviricetes sp.]